MDVTTISTVDSSMYTPTKNLFTAIQFDFLCQLDTHESEELYGLDFPSLAMLDDVIDNCSNVATLLRRVSIEKVGLIGKNEWNSDCFRMLCILGIIGEGIGMPIDDKASETTFYRRFAILLDYVFGDTDINMVDGEIVAEATRMAMEQNGYDATNQSGRKIDLLLKLKDTSIELASNEWKSNKAKSLELKQQSRNLRSNCAILNKLYMKVEQKSTPSWLLMSWRTLLTTRLDRIKRSSSTDDMTMTHNPSLPFVFFTPKNKRIRKRSI
ncbi:hypothetical protein DFQ30_000622 [Apophysomyces sp. BC1015]|nr:hypothetical protein DFQ30_000622 [Apophysomyces sp. BC1015]